MARAIDWAVDRPAGAGGRFLTVNAGSDDRNFQVKDLANAVARRVPGTDVSINTSAPVDSRSYKVDFGLFRSLAPDHQPVVSLDQSIQNLVDGLKKMDFKDADFRSSDLIRLKVLQDHMDTGRLDERLAWR
jgi:UDP-glucose 4-epimerase